MSAPEPAGETFPAFIERHGVKFEFTDVGPSAMTTGTDHDRYSPTYGQKVAGRRYTVRGTAAHLSGGGVRWVDLPEFNGSIADAQNLTAHRIPRTGRKRSRKPNPPNPADYLSCLHLDSSYAEYGIDELADEIGGGDMKPTEIIALHAGCIAARDALRRLLGPAVAELDGLEGW